MNAMYYNEIAAEYAINSLFYVDCITLCLNIKVWRSGDVFLRLAQHRLGLVRGDVRATVFGMLE